MNPKKMLQEIGNHNLDLQERLFRLIILIGLCGLVIKVIAGMILKEDGTNTIPLVISLIIFACITWFTLRSRKIQLGALIISATFIYIVLPFNFLTSGGIYGGAPIWFLFGFVFVSLVINGKAKYILLVSGYILFLFCYYLSYFHPELIIQHTLNKAYVDSGVTLTIVSMLTCSMILFQSEIYRSENAIAQKQNKEIEALNRAQSRFFSSMSHEIRTPINTIIGLNEMILREAVSDEVAADAKSIQNASKMLLALINDILDMSKIESGKMDIVPVNYDVGAMLSDIVNMPEMDGIECLHAIRSQTGGLNHSTPVAVLTANAGGENQELYRREGFDGYLLKPISGTKLEMEVFKHLPRELVSVTNSSGDIGVVETPVLAHNTKMRILISTDSVCDIPEYLTKKFQIAVMPYRVITEGGEFLDGVEAETEGILSYIGVRGKQARSKSPEVADYEDFFAEQLTKAQYVIHITMAQNASQGYANALELVQNLLRRIAIRAKVRI